jgi:hypothetical protein
MYFMEFVQNFVKTVELNSWGLPRATPLLRYDRLHKIS